MFKLVMLVNIFRVKPHEQYQVRVAVFAALSSRSWCHFVEQLKLRMSILYQSWCGQIRATWLEVAITLLYYRYVP